LGLFHALRSDIQFDNLDFVTNFKVTVDVFNTDRYDFCYDSVTFADIK